MTTARTTRGRGVAALLAWAVATSVAFPVGQLVRASEPAAPPPTVMILYHPYGVAMQRDYASPVPDYSAWTDERMTRDADRLGQLGVDVVLLALDVGDIRSGDRMDRYARFAQILAVAPDATGSAGAPAWPRLAFWLDAASPVRPDDVAGFFSWCVQAGIPTAAAVHRLQGRPLVVFSPRLSERAQRHPAFTTRRTAGPGAEWVWESSGATALCGRSPDGEQAVVLASLASASPTGAAQAARPGLREWLVPRRSGRTLRDAVRAAFAPPAAPPRILCISSWNDYQAADFVEPNSIDADRVCQRLRKELGWVHRTQRPPSGFWRSLFGG